MENVNFLNKILELMMANKTVLKFWSSMLAIYLALQFQNHSTLESHLNFILSIINSNKYLRVHAKFYFSKVFMKNNIIIHLEYIEKQS